jgi:hypothetical protein
MTFLMDGHSGNTDLHMEDFFRSENGKAFLLQLWSTFSTLNIFANNLHVLPDITGCVRKNETPVHFFTNSSFHQKVVVLEKNCFFLNCYFFI